MAAGRTDGTHVKIMPPGSRREDYLNRKFFHSINMQAVCDHRGVFLDVFAGYPGSVRDSRVLKCSPLYPCYMQLLLSQCLLARLSSWRKTYIRDIITLNVNTPKFQNDCF
ncbi:putative nuclease HARBI1 [Acanthaster planci]|uniref:Nuclease HARBI1 n=1 Tax=Acanthaster planci TaxID=133434 RepID=A0A8B7XNU9_ACAPL|nr:putative nuclease HARBI1 [Acanthaster planci]